MPNTSNFNVDRQYNLDLYKTCRSLEEHENDLINQRTTWFITIESVITATYGFSLQKYHEVYGKYIFKDDCKYLSKEYIQGASFELFLLILCVIGVFSAVSAHKSIKAATDAQRGIRLYWNSQKDNSTGMNTPPLAGGGDHEDRIRYLGSTFSRGIVWLFGTLWLLISIVTLTLIYNHAHHYYLNCLKQI